MYTPIFRKETSGGGEGAARLGWLRKISKAGVANSAGLLVGFLVFWPACFQFEEVAVMRCMKAKASRLNISLLSKHI